MNEQDKNIINYSNSDKASAITGLWLLIGHHTETKYKPVDSPQAWGKYEFHYKTYEHEINIYNEDFKETPLNKDAVIVSRIKCPFCNNHFQFAIGFKRFMYFSPAEIEADSELKELIIKKITATGCLTLLTIVLFGISLFGIMPNFSSDSSLNHRFLLYLYAIPSIACIVGIVLKRKQRIKLTRYGFKKPVKYIFNKVGDDSPILKYQDKLIGTIQSAGTDSNSHKVLEKKYFSKNGNSYLTPPEDKSYTKEYFIVDINDAFKSLG